MWGGDVQLSFNLKHRVADLWRQLQTFNILFYPWLINVLAQINIEVIFVYHRLITTKRPSLHCIIASLYCINTYIVNETYPKEDYQI